MKILLALALCFACVLGILGTGIAGNWAQVEAEAGAAVPPAKVEKTGQTKTYGARDDGDLQMGAVWPKPRFKDNNNGTVRDNLTGLIWLKNASCDKFYATDETGGNYRMWTDALTAANKLKSGFCGLTDGSLAGSWRLPNRKELESLIDLGFWNPALPNTAGTGRWREGHPFSGVWYWSSCPWGICSGYWSSSTHARYTNWAWEINYYDGSMDWRPKDCGGPDGGSCFGVWPVRGGH